MAINLNVDPNEIHRFSRFATAWWNLDGPYKTLHAINPLRMQFIQELSALKNIDCLDIGCGGGLVAEALARQGARVTGIDMDPTAIETAQKHAAEHHLVIDYHLTTTETLATHNPAAFDVITCLDMLEHVPDPKAIIGACAHLCKPGGKVFFSTLNRNFKSYMGAIIAAEYLLKLVPRGTHQYQRFIKPSELQQWSLQSGLVLLKQTGIYYNPLTASAQLTSQLGIHYITAYQKLNDQ